MSSPPGALSEDQLQCPICLSVFTEPVSTPCGHNFCKACIHGFWTNQTVPQCPCCRETCRPAEIRVNTGLRDIVDFFKSRKAEVGSEARPGEVPCDVCPGSKLKALKTCLVCLVSYCHHHLEPHHRVPSLMKHQLEEPLANLAHHVCQKHDKTFELFCRNDQVSVCVLCLKDEHLGHKTVSLKEEAEDRKLCLGKAMLKVKQQGEHKAVEIQEAKRSSKEKSRAVEEDTQKSVALLQGLVVSTQAYMVQMPKVMKERQRSEEMKVLDLLKKLHLELAQLQQKSKELDALSQTKDPQLFLNCSSAFLPPSPYFSPPPGTQQPLCAAEVKTMVKRLKQTLSKEMQRILGVEEDELKVQQQHWVEMELDADTAHPCLVLSQDEKGVREGQLATQNLPSNPKRFDFHHWVLAKKSYSSGRFYFQVEVGAQKGWAIGVVRDSIQRKSLCINLMPEHGFWTLGLYQGRYQANTSPPTALSLGHQPQKVGVSVDYDKGSVSFYDVDTRNLIYCFSGCTFNASLFSRVPYYPRTSIYPFFHPSDQSNDGDLTISPVQQEKK